MGGSSSQVVGYRYYAKFAAFIGNRIEKLIGINFDNRGWIVKDQDDASSILNIDKPYLYGENEGGVYGDIEIYNGTPDQQPSATYQEYFPLVSGYPYQSYLIFRGSPLASRWSPAYGVGGFYLGNSGYMKEMLLWVQRIHVKNDGSKQWYDEKSEVGSGIQRYFPSDVYQPFQPTMAGTCSWIDPSGRHTVPWGAGTFPFIEVGQSYSYTYDYEKMEIVHQYKFPRSPGASDPSVVHMVSKYGMAMSNEPFTQVAPLEWIGGVPKSDMMWSGAVIRSFKYSGLFFWGGGIFDAKLITTPGAIVEIMTEDNVPILTPFYIEDWDRISAKLYRLDLPPGVYKISVTIGGRYPSFENDYPPRPYAQMFLRGRAFTETEYGDINPIHKIREILTDETAMGKPETDINNTNFMKAADRIWGEGLGVSWAVDEKSCIEAIEELCYHIEAGVRVNRQTGLYEMVLFRDNWFEENEIHTIAENKIKDLSLEVMNSDDIVNQLNVTYYDRERIKNSTFSVYENGSILTTGHANAESIEFPYFMNMRNAEIVSNWKLKQFSTPAWSGSFTTGWREARKWNRYDLIRLPWSKKWNGTILARIMKINLGNGTDNTVTIDFEEVIPYSGEMSPSIVVDESMNEGVIPPQPSINAVFEVPYYLTVLRAGQTNADLELSNNPDIGYIAAIAAKPQNNSLNALLYTDGGVGEFEQVSRLDYCDILQLDQPINETASTFVVTGSLTQTANSNNLILLNDELMGFVSFDDETKVLAVKRGVLDTVPKKHSSGSLFVFDLPDVAFDSTQYAQSEVVEAQVLTTTPSGIQELLATGAPIEIHARAIRPYPPANIKINNVFMPSYFEDDFTLTWSDRNRLQQTGGIPLGYFESSISLEPNTQTLLTIAELDADDVELATHNVNVTALNSYTLLESVMQAGTRTLRINLKTVRDGYECLNAFDHTVRISNLIAPQNVTFEVIEL